MSSWVEKERAAEKHEFHFINFILSHNSHSIYQNQLKPISLYLSRTLPEYHHMSWGTHMYVVYNHPWVEGDAYICTLSSQLPAYMLSSTCIWVEGPVIHSLHNLYHHSHSFPTIFSPKSLSKHSKHEMTKLWHLLPLAPYPLRLWTYSTTLGSPRII